MVWPGCLRVDNHRGDGLSHCSYIYDTLKVLLSSGVQAGEIQPDNMLENNIKTVEVRQSFKVKRDVQYVLHELRNVCTGM